MKKWPQKQPAQTLEIVDGVEVEPEFEGAFVQLDSLPDDKPKDRPTRSRDRIAALEELGGPPLIALVGRPNVGKSRLYNRLTKTRHAIVEDLPGVTRDRQYGEGTYDGRAFQVVDTGGFEPDSTDILLAQMREQAQLAMEEAQVIFFMLDAQTGVMPADHDIVKLLRQSDKLVYFIVNKVDGERHEDLVHEFYELGPDKLFGISAEHGRGLEELMDDVAAFLPRASDSHEFDGIRVAVVGCPNAGKSTLVNSLLGTDRLLTSDVPGTTRDSVNTYIERGDKDYLFIDTAGIRRKRSIAMQVEKYSVVHAFKAIDRADVVLYVIDATRGVTNQDQRIAGLAAKKGCAMILLLNKWDLIEKDHTTAGEYATKLRDELKFARFAPIITISAHTKQRVHRIFPMIDAAYESYIERVGTGRINRFLEKAIQKNPPKGKSGTLRFYYASQVATRPPTFMFVVNNSERVHFSYERYMINQLRSEFGFEGAPIKVFFRARGKKEDGPK